MRVYCYTPFHLCRSNLLDLARIRQLVGSESEHGLELVDDPSGADVIIITTCAFDQEHENSSLNELARIKREFPAAKLVVGGCLPEIDPVAMESFEPDAVFSPRKFDQLASFLDLKPGLDSEPGSIQELESECGSFELPRPLEYRLQAMAWNVVSGLRKGLLAFGISSMGLDTLYRIGFHYSKQTLFVRATEGCLGSCTYCAIRKARGTLKSRPIERISAAVQAGLNKGFDTIALVSDDLASYGRDLGVGLPDLLENLARLEKGFELALDNVNPAGLAVLKKDLFRFFEKNMVSYMEVPVQSGSNRILKLMGRPYRAEDAFFNLDEIKKRFPRVILATHIMVGFPGETRQDFEESCQWIRNAPVDHFTILAYQERPGTPAAGFDNKVPMRERRARKAKALALAGKRFLSNLLCFRKYQAA
ncbi:MAG: radical SAM protein [Deltaproteobacteria bacterium]|nr:radical SAM protein [Deltaproteobacteria bacterium]